MITSRSSRFMIIFLSAFILADVIPSESMAIRFGLPGLVEAVVGSHPSITRRFVGTAPRERAKSPGRRGQKSSQPKREPQDESHLKLPEGLLSLEERAALLEEAKKNCQPTLALLDKTVETLRKSSWKLGSAAQDALDLGYLVQEQRNDPRNLEDFSHNRQYGEEFLQMTGKWNESVSAARDTLLSLDPFSIEGRSFDRIRRIIEDLHRAFGVPYKDPL